MNSTISPQAKEHPAISPTLRINEMARKLQAEGQQVYHLGFGESQCPPPDCLVEALQRHAAEVSYLPVQGLPALREAIARQQSQVSGQAVHAGQVIVTPGSKGALYLAINQIEGDVLLPRPSWVSYAPQSRFSGKKTFWIDTRAENNYVPTPAEIERTVLEARSAQGDPRILVLNSPNNPTGAVIGPDALRDIAEIAGRHDLVIISDEIYSNLMPPGRFQSIQHDYPEGTIVTSGLSKDVGVGGWRLGWGILPDTERGRLWMARFNALASELWSSAASPIQYATIDALQANPDITEYIDRVGAFHRTRTLKLYEGLSALKLSMPKPPGGYYVYPDFGHYREGLRRADITTSDDLQWHLMERYQIATLAGTAFGHPPEALCLRLSSTFLDCCPKERGDRLWAQWRQLPRGERDTFATPETHPQLFAAIGQFERFIGTLA